ncbi:sensor histidine kinase [Streptomyces goshikiensis]|uniref:sensor histidine kinase n=1 Tax=Streptomyces goshikiensis TaxID=1942 RepID=UPI0036B9E8F0
MPALSGRIRWGPHAAVVALALAAAVVALWTGGSAVGGLGALLVGVPVLLTLVVPVPAWWVTLLAVIAGSLDLGGFGGTRFAFLLVVCPLVLVLCTLRTRPWAAAWIWAISVLVVFGGGGVLELHFLAPFLVYALAAIIAVLLAGWLRAGRRAGEQAAVADDERSRRARLEERTAIARELHDVVAHHMSVVAIQAEAAPYRVENPPPELAETFAALRENAVLALGELRRILGVIRADSERAKGSAARVPQPTLARLDTVIAGVRGSGSAVTKSVTGKVRVLAPGIELSAYRIVQEALSNVLRHAPGAAVGVELSYVSTGLVLRVVNGPARHPAAASPGSGHGLMGMRERIAMLEGRLTARPTSEGGFEVVAFLPAVSEVREEDVLHA